MAAVTFVRSGLMMPGKFPQGQRYVENRIKWLKEKFGVEASLMVLLGGTSRAESPWSRSRIASPRSRRSDERSSVARFPKSSPPSRRSVRARRDEGSDLAEDPVIDHLMPVA